MEEIGDTLLPSRTTHTNFDTINNNGGDNPILRIREDQYLNCIQETKLMETDHSMLLHFGHDMLDFVKYCKLQLKKWIYDFNHHSTRPKYSLQILEDKIEPGKIYQASFNEMNESGNYAKHVSYAEVVFSSNEVSGQIEGTFITRWYDQAWNHGSFIFTATAKNKIKHGLK
jgi:hypothetical protein